MGRAKGKRPLGLIKNHKDRALTFRKRRAGLMKKISELSTLCDIKTCMLCYGEDGQLQAWPPQPELVDSVLKQYCNLDEAKSEQGKENLITVFEKQRKQGDKQIQKSSESNLFSTWDDEVDQLSEEGMRDLVGVLDGKLEKMRDRADLIKMRERADLLLMVNDNNENSVHHRPLLFSDTMIGVSDLGTGDHSRFIACDDFVLRDDNVPMIDQLPDLQFWQAMVQLASFPPTTQHEQPMPIAQFDPLQKFENQTVLGF